MYLEFLNYYFNYFLTVSRDGGTCNKFKALVSLKKIFTIRYLDPEKWCHVNDELFWPRNKESSTFNV